MTFEIGFYCTNEFVVGIVSIGFSVYEFLQPTGCCERDVPLVLAQNAGVCRPVDCI